MTRRCRPNPYAGSRYPPEIISHAVWLYFRFALSLSHGGRDAGGPRHRCEPRDRAAVGTQVRSGLRKPDPPQAARPWRQVAPRRSVPDDQGNEALALAGRRPGWGRGRRSRPEPTRQEGRQALAPQAAEAADPRAACDDYGQAGELQRREG